MKKLLFAFAAMIVWTACGNKQAAVPTEGNEASDKVAFEVAKNYFFKNDQEIPASPKITTAEEFGKLFGMATTMGKDGKPTEIDFTKQFVLAIVLSVTNLATEITPNRLEKKGDTLFYFYDAKVGEAQTYSTQPISLIILDKKYADKTVVMVNEQVKDYYAAVERYLAEQIYNYKQEGDILKCVSGGSHPGLMHISQIGENFYVSDFEQVEDGSRFLPTAKRIFGEYFGTFQIHHSDGDEHESLRHDVLRAFVRDHDLTATMYQDYGWPAKELK